MGETGRVVWRHHCQDPCIHRRAFLASALTGLAFPSVVRSAESAPLRIGLTPVFLDDQVTFLQEWQRYLESQLRRPIRFVQRGSYREITELILNEKLDFAWVCGFPYVRYRNRMRLVAVPLFNKQPLYQSYVIVPNTDGSTRSIADLRAKIYAYSDPNSNSGWLVPQVQLSRLGADPGSFFKRTFFTWSHRKVVDAVASGLAQGGSMDGYVWETLRLLHPELVSRTRIVSKSETFGFPPIVARSGIPTVEFASVRDVLTGMATTSQGRTLLGKLNLDGFERGKPALFEGIAANMRQLGLG